MQTADQLLKYYQAKLRDIHAMGGTAWPHSIEAKCGVVKYSTTPALLNLDFNLVDNTAVLSK